MNPGSLEGTRAIVTGAGRGIGAAIALAGRLPSDRHEDVKSVARRGVDLSESLQVFAAASHTEYRRADSDLVGVHFETGADSAGPAVIKYGEPTCVLCF